MHYGAFYWRHLQIRPFVVVMNTQCLGHVFIVSVVVYRRLARRCRQSMGHQRWFITLDRARGWGGDWFSHVLL